MVGRRPGRHDCSQRSPGEPGPGACPGRDRRPEPVSPGRCPPHRRHGERRRVPVGIVAFCSGTLIHERAFLTAGHCTGPSSFGPLPAFIQAFVSLSPNALDPRPGGPSSRRLPIRPSRHARRRSAAIPHGGCLPRTGSGHLRPRPGHPRSAGTRHPSRQTGGGRCARVASCGAIADDLRGVRIHRAWVRAAKSAAVRVGRLAPDKGFEIGWCR